MQTVTLLVDPEGAERLALGMHEGKVHLTLRNPEDSDTLSLASISTRQVLGTAAAPAPQPRAASRPAPRRNQMAVTQKPPETRPAPATQPEPYKPSIIRGGKVTEQEPANK
jgi:Flp pilus assembly protein CpaB